MSNAKAAQRTEQLRTAPDNRDLIGGTGDSCTANSITADVVCLPRPSQRASIRRAEVARHRTVTGEVTIARTAGLCRHELANG
jgi:hypothetical protein